MTVQKSAISNWLAVSETQEPGVYKTDFAEHHLGNTFIRSLHGGVSASFIEVCAEAEAAKHVDDDASLAIINSSTDYLRVTKDDDLYGRATILKISRRLAVIDVTCWQDEETMPVVRGVVSLKIGTMS